MADNTKLAGLCESLIYLDYDAIEAYAESKGLQLWSARTFPGESFSSSLFSASTLTIWTSPGVRICFCETFKLSLF